MKQPHIIGVISDTHELLRPEAVVALEGSELIIHAGDVGKPEILDELRKIAPVVPVRGNVDAGIWAQGLPQTRTVEIDGVRIYVIHNINDLAIDAAASGYAAVVSGHSHRPSSVQKNGVLFLNPGSAGPRRFNMPVSLAWLRVMRKTVEAELAELEVESCRGRGQVYRSDVGSYFVVIKYQGKQHRHCLRTKDREIARKNLVEYRQQLLAHPAADRHTSSAAEVSNSLQARLTNAARPVWSGGFRLYRNRR